MTAGILFNFLCNQPVEAPIQKDDELTWAWRLFENKQEAVDFIGGLCGTTPLIEDDKHMLFIVGGWMSWAFFLVSEEGISRVVDPTAGSANLPPWGQIRGKINAN